MTDSEISSFYCIDNFLRIVDIHEIPDLYRGYEWESDWHHQWGYLSDKFPEFNWIRSLETRFKNSNRERSFAPAYLIREMIYWGGNQNGVLSKFEMGLGKRNLTVDFATVLDNLDCPKKAISAATEINGMGITYASKLLRFLRPDSYGALDSQINSFLRRGSTSAATKDDFVKFTDLLVQLKDKLHTEGIGCPTGGEKAAKWRAADIEMAIFRKATTRKMIS